MREEKATAEKHSDTGILFKRAVLAALGLAVAAFVLIDQRTNLFVYAITQDGPPSMLPREDEGDEATGNKGVATGSKESGNEESLVLQWPSDVSVVPPLVNVTLSGAGQV